VSRPVHDAAVAALNESRAEVIQLRKDKEQEREVLQEEVRASNQAHAETTRAAVSKQLREQLSSQIDAGRLQVRDSRGRLLIDLPQDLLFPSQGHRLGDIGEETVRALAKALTSLPGWSFRVEVHAAMSDSPAMATDEDSWIQTSNRATSVVQLLVTAGVPPAQLSATGLGSFRPRADNRSEDGRALNRRIEVIVEPGQ